ncbi:unnamed protein product [Lupinus luteus]|uniref:Chaoptin n=1 Tax=Lupinus luteus TaxID=3873 RepID=A0AAV1X5U4_LUPLU
MRDTNLIEELSTFFQHLYFGCIRYSIQELHLESNEISGTLLDLSAFPSLKTLLLSGNPLSGKIPHSIKLPYHFESLDVGSNSLEGGILISFGNACTLRSLILSYNPLSEELPLIIHHLFGCARHSLQEFYLDFNQINDTILDISTFSSLKELYLSENRLNGKIPEYISFLPQIQTLRMGVNILKGVIIEYHFANMSKLTVLDLSNNSLDLIFSQKWVPSFQLVTINLISYKLGPSFPKWLQTQFNSITLDISNAEISYNVLEWFWHITTKLGFMNISYNNLMGTIPNFPLWLNWYSPIIVAANQFEGSIPPFLRNLSSNNLNGQIPKSFKNFSAMAEDGFLFHDALTYILNDTSELHFHLAAYSYEYDLSTLLMWKDVENIFKNDNLLLKGIDLSSNQLTNEIPSEIEDLVGLVSLNLSRNNLSGKIPLNIGRLTSLDFLDLSGNHLSGSIPSSLTQIYRLGMLDLSHNHLSGKIPTATQLQSFNASSYEDNLNLCGMPLQKLCTEEEPMNEPFVKFDEDKDSLNHLYENLPLSLCYLSNINFLDLSSNNLNGQIPKSFKNFSAMAEDGFLFHDALTYILNDTSELHFHLAAYSYEYDLSTLLMWKDVENIFKNDNLLLKGIDLSSNQLTNEIPSEIEDLVGLVSLNLSRNNLSGKIPLNIGRLTSLDFLDLSGNHLSGSIPSSLTQIYRLGMLDLSHNHLSGKIPTATQLQSFNASSYEDNLNLCGMPLQKLCTEEEPMNEPFVKFDEDKDSFLLIASYYFGQI